MTHSLTVDTKLRAGRWRRQLEEALASEDEVQHWEDFGPVERTHTSDFTEVPVVACKWDVVYRSDVNFFQARATSAWLVKSRIERAGLPIPPGLIDWMMIAGPGDEIEMRFPNRDNLTIKGRIYEWK